MDRVAVFVDAGYLFAQGSTAITGSKKPRTDLTLENERVLDELDALAQRIAGLPLLRIYWYDGTSGAPSAQHISLAHQARVKVRLGYLNSSGEQKGVDSLIVTDMISLARNRGMADAVLLSGDEDLRVGVQQAQEHGVKVHLLGIAPSRGSQSLALMQEADSCYEWDKDVVGRFLAHTPRTPLPRPAPSSNPAPAGGTIPIEAAIEQAARESAAKVSTSDIEAVISQAESARQIPTSIDRPLLGTAGRLSGATLTAEHKRLLRDRFVEHLKLRLGTAG